MRTPRSSHSPGSDDFEPSHEPDDDADQAGDNNQSADLDEDFPLGDGSADTVSMVVCPYCGESVELSLDPGSGVVQEYVEDCEVCCQPWRVQVTYQADGTAEVSVTPLSS